MDYAMPRADDFPAIVIDHLETLSPLNPLGLKGVGESGTLPVTAVIASAVEDALGERGMRVERVPLTPAVLRGLWRS
jgi:CO/xanthine dehydrogenase Mo-binding subunit